jgi:hypothetical protein
MNIFQKQLILNNGNTLAEEYNKLSEIYNPEEPLGHYSYLVGKTDLAPSPVSITFDEFEKIMNKTKGD